MNSFDLFRRFAERELGHPLESVRPQSLSGWQVIEALWPLNEVLRPHAGRVGARTYDAGFEPEVDRAIEQFAENAVHAWGELSDGAWRVFLERQRQALLVAAANEKEGNPLMSVPPSFSEEQRSVAAVISLLYQMKLPWPPTDQSRWQPPQGGPPGSLRRH